jgi:hypothetical protein
MDIRAFRLAAHAFFDGKSSDGADPDVEGALTALPLSLSSKERPDLHRLNLAQPGDTTRGAIE